jgi:hypothetical protein
MIVFDLECRAGGHRFEGWFASSEDFSGQQARGLVCCPTCGALDIGKALSAPHLGRKGNQLPAPVLLTHPEQAPVPAKAVRPQPMTTQPVTTSPLPPEAAAMMQAMAAMQVEMLKASTWVGDTFAEDVRAMHYGEKEAVLVHGRATSSEVRDLLDEGIPVAPVLVPLAPPGELN